LILLLAGIAVGARDPITMLIVVAVGAGRRRRYRSGRIRERSNIAGVVAVSISGIVSISIRGAITEVETTTVISAVVRPPV
jgi:hypothetical protein